MSQTVNSIYSDGNQVKPCGCVVFHTSTNTYRTVTYCKKHFNELSWDEQKIKTQTDSETESNIQEYFFEPEYEEEQHSYSGACGEPHLMLP